MPPVAAGYALACARSISRLKKTRGFARLPCGCAGKRRSAGRGRLRYFLACAVDVSAAAIVA